MKKITDREREVLDLISREYTTAEIAKLLNISDHTALDHRKHLLHKFEVRNAAGLIRKAYEHGYFRVRQNIK